MAAKRNDSWRQMVDTFSWVEQQQRMNKSGWATAQWVLEQQMRAIHGSESDDRRREAAEKRRAAHLRRRVKEEEAMSKEENKRKRSRETITWEEYQARWDAIHRSTQPLTFKDIPWPQWCQPSRPQHVSPQAIATFLCTDPDTTLRRKRALLVWHPDRFRRVMCRVVEKDREKVEEAVGIVARALTAKECHI